MFKEPWEKRPLLQQDKPTEETWDNVGGKIQPFTEIHISGGHISYSSENVQLKEIRTWLCNNRINNLHMNPQHREMGKTRARLKTLNGNQLAPNSN